MSMNYREASKPSGEAHEHVYTLSPWCNICGKSDRELVEEGLNKVLGIDVESIEPSDDDPLHG